MHSIPKLAICIQDFSTFYTILDCSGSVRHTYVVCRARLVTLNTDTTLPPTISVPLLCVADQSAGSTSGSLMYDTSTTERQQPQRWPMLGIGEQLLFTRQSTVAATFVVLVVTATRWREYWLMLTSFQAALTASQSHAYSAQMTISVNKWLHQPKVVVLGDILIIS